MQKWEYLSGTATDEELDEMGRDGWELVSSVYDSLNERVLHFLKRPLN